MNQHMSIWQYLGTIWLNTVIIILILQEVHGSLNRRNEMNKRDEIEEDIDLTVKLSLTWDQNCVLCTLAGASTFTMTDAKRYVPIVPLSTEDNAKLSKQWSEGFKIPVYRNKYNVIAEKSYNVDSLIRESIAPSCEGINRLFDFMRVVITKLQPIVTEDPSFQE